MCNDYWADKNRCDGQLCDNASQCKGNVCDGLIRTCKTRSTEDAIAGGIIAAIVIGVLVFCCCLPCIIFFCCIKPRDKSGEKALKEARKAMESQNQSNAQMN